MCVRAVSLSCALSQFSCLTMDIFGDIGWNPGWLHWSQYQISTDYTGVRISLKDSFQDTCSPLSPFYIIGHAPSHKMMHCHFTTWCPLSWQHKNIGIDKLPIPFWLNSITCDEGHISVLDQGCRLGREIVGREVGKIAWRCRAWVGEKVLWGYGLLQMSRENSESIKYSLFLESTSPQIFS